MTCYEKKQYVVGFAGNKSLDEAYLKDYLKPLIERNFEGCSPKIYYRTDENTIMLKIYSKQVYDYFKCLGFNPGKKSSIVKIPEEILSNELFLKFTIRGIFDTDGCVFFDKRKGYTRAYPRITLQMKSIILIEQLEKHLSMKFKLYVNKSNRDNHRNYLEIYGHKQLESFLKEIGFSNSRHLNRISASMA